MVLSVMAGVGGRRGRITDTCYRNVMASVRFPMTEKGAPVGSDAPRHELGGVQSSGFCCRNPNGSAQNWFQEKGPARGVHGALMRWVMRSASFPRARNSIPRFEEPFTADTNLAVSGT